MCPSWSTRCRPCWCTSFCILDRFFPCKASCSWPWEGTALVCRPSCSNVKSKSNNVRLQGARQCGYQWLPVTHCQWDSVRIATSSTRIWKGDPLNLQKIFCFRLYVDLCRERRHSSWSNHRFLFQWAKYICRWMKNQICKLEWFIV